MTLFSRWLRKLFVFSLLLYAPFVSEALNYSARINESRWIVDGNELECRLQQAIPAFGRASFARRAGEAAVFRLDSYERPVSAGSVKLIAAAPLWKPQSFDIVLGKIDTFSTNVPIEIDHPMSDRLLAHLQEGRSPVFSEWHWYEGERPVEVGVSVVNFMPAYREYQQCIAGLLQLDFNELATSQLNFDTDEYELTPVIRQRLSAVAQLLQADPEVRHCYIDGYTDDVGTSRYNMDLSRRRAEAVEHYFVGLGVDASRITTRFHGEANWVSNAVDEKARAENRRVTVRLER